MINMINDHDHQDEDDDNDDGGDGDGDYNVMAMNQILPGCDVSRSRFCAPRLSINPIILPFFTVLAWRHMQVIIVTTVIIILIVDAIIIILTITRPGWNRHTCDCALTSYHGPACARDAPTLILPDLTSLPVFLKI